MTLPGNNTLAYLFIFPDLLLLRHKRPEAYRPYRVPGGMGGAWLVTILSMFYTIIVSYFLIFPDDGTIKGSGVSRLTYELIQLITLGAIILLTAIFYLWGRAERRRDEQSDQIGKNAPAISQSLNEEAHSPQR